MEGSTADDERLVALTSVGAQYGAMLGATVAGQLLGIAVAASFGSRALWLPGALGVLFEAFAGARAGAWRAGHPLSPGKCAWVSATYSLGLMVLSVPLAAWLIASGPSGSNKHVSLTAFAVASAVLLVFVATVVRWGLMVAFSRSWRPGARPR